MDPWARVCACLFPASSPFHGEMRIVVFGPASVKITLNIRKEKNVLYVKYNFYAFHNYIITIFLY